MTPRVDAHCHLWRLERGDYGWLDGDGGPLAPIRRDFEVADLRAAGAAMGTEAFVAVQAAPSVAETRHLLDQARIAPEIVGVVGWVDLSDPAAEADLERLAADPRFVGVRPMLQDLPDPDWIATRPAPAAMAALSRLGLCFDALVTPVHLQALQHFAERHGDLPIMIDHAAKPAVSAPADDPRHALWRVGMQALAHRPGVCVKLSGLLTELPAERRRTPDDAVAALRPLVDHLLDWFGPERLAWGSDWPVLTLASQPAVWAEVSERLLAPLNEAGRAAVRGDTACRFYGLTVDAVA
ncbi:amidohydrolase family protein [Lichenihabitans sp. Uapishka_5]|uniref:amidohydrolase family protein n=1 Tax=Lichenihabitans sp. Uapishka_5 TaxID=3037302 RepID=UPI0029E7D0B4|nr:amidohydrolase family protein [Lichenihabitans sp. Uapishka_5]MDX7951581.1 amidohydrolase family protein [Lichenihabitans sp. Uapishka_5]